MTPIHLRVGARPLRFLLANRAFCGVIVVYSVGKSCLLLRFADDTYTESYISTIGVDFVSCASDFYCANRIACGVHRLTIVACV